MSHVTPIKARITDLAALEAAAARFGGSLVRDQQTFRYYTGSRGRSAHALKFPGCSYEVGVQQTGEAGVYGLAWDSFETALRNLLGGEGAPLLVQAYAHEKAKLELAADGWAVREIVHENGELEAVGEEW